MTPEELVAWSARIGPFDDRHYCGKDLTVAEVKRAVATMVAATRAAPSPASRRCSCTHEAGDSRCDAHPTCSECGDVTDRNVDDCADHCQACASLRRGHAITDWTAACSACKARGPLPKGG